jgi:hypothetical protein
MNVPHLARAQEATAQPVDGLTSSGWENLLGIAWRMQMQQPSKTRSKENTHA